MNLRVAFFSAVLLLNFFAFQNCGTKVGFTTPNQGFVATTESVSGAQTLPSASSQVLPTAGSSSSNLDHPSTSIVNGSDSSTVSGSVSSAVSGTVVGKIPGNSANGNSSPAVVSSSGESNSKVPEDGSLKDDSDKTDSDADLVECELVPSKEKIAFSTDLRAQTSNSSKTRVCVSKYACLTLINKYAEDRNCTLTTGKKVAETSNLKCTVEFPGSKGTCHKADARTDKEVEDLLISMERE
jgi:hypothetical protein